MKTIIILGYSATIMLVALSLIESTRITSIQRANDFLESQALKYRLIDEFLLNLNRKQVLNILSAYVLDEIELKAFVLHLNLTGKPPHWSETHELKNRKLYEFLRYDSFVELNSRNKNQAIEDATHLKMTIFQNAPDVLVDELCDVYINGKLYELISLEDYYALRVLVKHHNQIGMENPVGWRIKRALYSFAIRQYSPSLISNLSPIICFHKIFFNTRQVFDIKKKQKFLVPRFMFCTYENMLEKLQSRSPANYRNSLVYYLSSEIVISDPRLILNLNDLLINDRPVYCLFPNLKLIAFSDSVEQNTTYGLITFVKMKTVPIQSTSKWLAEMANIIEDYKRKEREYFNVNPASLIVSDEST